MDASSPIFLLCTNNFYFIFSHKNGDFRILVKMMIHLQVTMMKQKKVMKTCFLILILQQMKKVIIHLLLVKFMSMMVWELWSFSF